jgi:hypothetical protein
MTTPAPSESSLTGYSPPLLRPRRRRQWVLFVTLNLLAYLAACLFWQYLQTGQWFDPGISSLREDLTRPLGSILLRPLSIFHQPWMIFVVAGLLSVLITVPLATAVMYQLLLSMAFVIIVALVGRAPFLGLALAAGCILSARMQLRRKYPLLAILLGIVPVLVYLYLLTQASLDTSLLLPLQRWILPGPFLLAVVFFAISASLVIVLARLVKFQPGVIWPSWLLGLALAGWAFFAHIGPAELHYALLVEDLTGGEVLFAPRPRRATPQPTPGEPGLNRDLTRLRDDLHRRRTELLKRCESFLATWPQSRRAPSVAWIAAQAQSVRLNLAELDSPVIAYAVSQPQPESRAIWAQLLEQYPKSDQAALAALHLGQLALVRAGELEPPAAQSQLAAAVEQLTQARQHLAEIARRDLDESYSPVGGEIVAPLPDRPEQSAYTRSLFEADTLLWRIEVNRASENPIVAQGLARLIALHPADPDAIRKLRLLAEDDAYKNTSIAGNIQIALARANPNLYDRVAALKTIAAQHRQDPDAAIEANYELGRLWLHAASAPFVRWDLKPPEEYFRIVVAAPPSPWQQRAAEHLARLKAAAPTRENTTDE